MNKRRQLAICLGASALLSLPLRAFAQKSGKVHRIGFLIAETVSGQTSRVDSLRAGLRENGYVEGENVAIEIREAKGEYSQLPALAAELTRSNVDVIVPFGIKALYAARTATSTIPLVVPTVGDPVEKGLVSSLSRPGGNITGLTTFGAAVSTKRFELLRESVPKVKRVAFLNNPASPATCQPKI